MLLQNYAIFSHHDKNTGSENISEYPYCNFIVSRSDWDVLNEFVQKTGWDIVFGLNDNVIENRTTGVLAPFIPAKSVQAC